MRRLLLLGCLVLLAAADNLSVCGDGVLDEGEECDDGNLSPFDGCSPDCRLEHVAAPKHLDVKQVEKKYGLTPMSNLEFVAYMLDSGVNYVLDFIES